MLFWLVLSGCACAMVITVFRTRTGQHERDDSRVSQTNAGDEILREASPVIEQPESTGRKLASSPPCADHRKTVPMASRTARSHFDVSWSTRTLFRDVDRPARSRAGAAAHDGLTGLPAANAGDYVFGSLTPVLAALLPELKRRRQLLNRKLRRAGFYGPCAAENFAALRYVLMMAPLLVLGLLLLFVPPQHEPLVLGLIVLGTAWGWALPGLYLQYKMASRNGEIQRSIPDLLDILNMYWVRGVALPAALERAHGELLWISPALAREVQIVCEQARLSTLEHALRNFRQRVDLPEVHSFISLLTQSRGMRVSLSEALADSSDNMRESLRLQADQTKFQATFQLLFPALLCLMPAICLFLLGPVLL